MKNFISKIAVVVFGLGVFAFAGAQTTQDIEQVNLKNDAFKNIRTIVTENFDYGKVEAKPGIYNSKVIFSLAPSGKIEKAEATGDNQFVNEQLEEVFNSILYKVSNNQLAVNSKYIMPVTVEITE